MTILRWGLLGLLLLLVGLPVYALPATLSLPPGRRPGLEPLTLPQAAQRLGASGKSGLALVEAARALVAQRMVYSRRNSFDGHARAFERGYGYCSQQAQALVDLLGRLGYQAKVVHAFRNRFPDGTVTAHAWVRVTVDGRAYDVDTLFYDPEAGRLAFTPLSVVQGVSPGLRLLEAWGAPAVNAHRYYLTGKDQDW